MEKITIKLKNITIKVDHDYYDCISDIITNEKILKLDEFKHHINITRLEHSIRVSMLNYKLCKLFGFDYISAARAGLLHDFFLYDWRNRRPKKFFLKHGFTHSRRALKNTKKNFSINEIEADMILKHMWPLNIQMPKYRETFVIIFTDKLTCINDIILSWIK